VIEIEDELEISLKENKLITLEADIYTELLGDMVIEVNTGQVRIKEETSPQNICSNMG
jgi:hypothetical protein